MYISSCFDRVNPLRYAEALNGEFRRAIISAGPEESLEGEPDCEPLLSGSKCITQGFAGHSSRYAKNKWLGAPSQKNSYSLFFDRSFLAQISRQNLDFLFLCHPCENGARNHRKIGTVTKQHKIMRYIISGKKISVFSIGF